MLSNLSKEEISALWSSYEAIFKQLTKQSSDKGVAALASRNDLERRYGRAYQKLVKAGLTMQIKQKYRRF